MHAVARSDCSQCFGELLLQGERSSQYGQILVFFPPSVQRSRVVFPVTMGSSKTQWWLHEGAPKDCGAAKVQSRSVDRRESPRVPEHARDSVLHFAEQVVLLVTAREKTCRHTAKPSVCVSCQPRGSSWSNRICCSSGPIDTTCFSRLAIRLNVRRPGRTTSRGFLISGSDRCAAGFARRQLWMKVRRNVEENAKP